MKALTYALALLAALRATRFVTQDWLGEWTIVRRAKAWSGRYEMAALNARLEREQADYTALVADGGEHTYVLSDGTRTDDPSAYVWDSYSEDDPITWQGKLTKGLDCPFCVGFWLTGAAVLAAAAANRGPRRRAAFQVLAGAFGANYLTGHISKRLDG